MIQAHLIDTDKQTVVDQLFLLPATQIDCVNWAEFPYKPSVSVRLGYSSTAMAILFEVEENHLRGLTMDDCGPVYEDSCCEFFMADPFSEKYFNFEINCIGTLLAAKRKSKEDFEFLSPSQLKEVLRFCSLPRAPIDSVAPNQKYWVAEVIPFSILGLKEPPKSILANFYKCGHKCQVPHYLSMAQIDLPAPSFHCPKFFQKVHFMNP
jgi:hypothetical protein